MNIVDRLEDQAKWCSVEEAGLLREAAGEIRRLKAACDKYSEDEVLCEIVTLRAELAALQRKKDDCYNALIAEQQHNEIVEAELAACREQCAVIAWTHYMNMCKQRGISPDATPYWCAAAAIRNADLWQARKGEGDV